MSGGDAYIHVRVPGAPRPDGSVLVYLPDGTGLVLNSSQLQASPDQRHPPRPRLSARSRRPARWWPRGCAARAEHPYRKDSS